MLIIICTSTLIRYAPYELHIVIRCMSYKMQINSHMPLINWTSSLIRCTSYKLDISSTCLLYTAHQIVLYDFLRFLYLKTKTLPVWIVFISTLLTSWVKKLSKTQVVQLPSQHVLTCSTAIEMQCSTGHHMLHVQQLQKCHGAAPPCRYSNGGQLKMSSTLTVESKLTHWMIMCIWTCNF